MPLVVSNVVKSILISQPEPQNGSPFDELVNKYALKVDFRPFIQVEGVSAKEFRKQKIHIPDYSAVILTSRTAIEHFFRICEEMRIEISEDMKYFCASEAIALYLQKFITYRKRKVFYPKVKGKKLREIIQKHKNETYLFVRSDVCASPLPDVLEKSKIKWNPGILYRTVSSDLSDLSEVNYDIVAFFSPSGIRSLFENFPDFKQGNTKIATFGDATTTEAEQMGLVVDIKAPTAECPSMKMALENYMGHTK
jgi:uroporphyrinogen-III synthase